MMNEEAWLAICFVAFVALGYKPIKAAILGFLDSKIALIRNELQQVQHAKIEAETEVQAIHAELSRVEEHHKEMLVRARQEIEDIYQTRCIELAKSLEFRTKAAEARFKQMKLEAVASVEQVFIDKVVEEVVDRMRSNASSKLDIKILENAA